MKRVTGMDISALNTFVQIKTHLRNIRRQADLFRRRSMKRAKAC